MNGEDQKIHFNGDDCLDGHIRPDGSHCVHDSWHCDHCHDDPPPFHTCPSCKREGARNVRD